MELFWNRMEYLTYMLTVSINVVCLLHWKSEQDAPMTRTDAHRPSVIEPADYSFVGFQYLRVDDLGAALFLADERRRIQTHMDSTGGETKSATFSTCRASSRKRIKSDPATASTSR